MRRIVCLGGGYVSLHVVRSLRTAIKSGQVEVTVIDRNNYHVFHGLIGETLVGKIQVSQIISPARRVFPPAKFHNAEIQDININQQEVITARFLDGREYRIPYDDLVLALGTVIDTSRLRGLTENTFRLKSYWDVFSLRSHLLLMLELAEIESDPEERKRLLTFVVAGGNYAGIEVASEISDFLQLLTKKEYSRLFPEEIRVVVIHSGPEILPELGTRFPKLVQYARRHIEQQGFHLKLNARLTSATALSAFTDQNEEIPSRTIISCTGNSLPPILEASLFEIEKSGRIATDEFLRVKGYENVWAGGDCAAVPHPQGGHSPPLAIFAMTAGKQIGRNILCTMSNKPVKAYRFTGLGDACALSRQRAVGHIYGIPLTGFPAWLVWRMFMFAYLPTWDRRIRAFLDWLVYPLVGRDVVSMRSDQPLDVNELHFEVGQTVIAQGDTGNAMFIINEGEVEVVREKEGDSRETTLAFLKAGDYFGEVALFQQCRRTATIRAKTSLKLLEIKRGVAERLRKSLEVQAR